MMSNSQIEGDETNEKDLSVCLNLAPLPAKKDVSKKFKKTVLKTAERRSIQVPFYSKENCLEESFAD